LEHDNRTYYTSEEPEDVDEDDFILGFILNIKDEIRAGNGSQAGFVCELDHMHHRNQKL
jgi:hypothetical protein